MRHRPRLSLAAALCALVAACASGGKASGDATDVAGAREVSAPRQAAPLAVFRAQPLVITPVQRLRTGDALGWGAAAGSERAQLATLDSALAEAARARGASGWKFAADVERAARRNPTMAPDPHALAIDELLASRQPTQLAGPLGSQLRALVALDGQRYVLVPTELRYARLADGRGEAVLRIVLLDARASRPMWTGEVRSAPADAYSRALLAGVADHFADLISPPDGAPGA